MNIQFPATFRSLQKFIGNLRKLPGRFRKSWSRQGKNLNTFDSEKVGRYIINIISEQKKYRFLTLRKEYGY